MWRNRFGRGFGPVVRQNTGERKKERKKERQKRVKIPHGMWRRS
jgi:hypothetical protein